MALPTHAEQMECLQRCIDTLEILLNHGSRSDIKQHELACFRAIKERIYQPLDPGKKEAR